MILADTSVWIDHFRRGNQSFSDVLSAGMILVHPFVSAELACGKLKNRAMILSDLHALPAARVPLTSKRSTWSIPGVFTAAGWVGSTFTCWPQR